MFERFKFIGAIDSAAPCGMLLEIAEALTPLLVARRAHLGGVMPCLRLIFFDGEEAFVSWTATDSIYGARRIAEQWSAEKDPYRPEATRLQSVHTLILLDLLGQARPALTSHFENTRPLFNRMQD
eukprot:CAMPEP_0206271756 /NCGR_PEP_ID=MMETSP0047_2-20121206/33607_1 /ASSEMBLY_ACC=CAM_ASM_000192 /TAXON_ID=195065 /ORGANISM="Chroomonas mesostigmatica_cf, Strain CCMP1168" /LENGTH=124 /DNA_ID=CAMNT_0053700557 /DNA_START=270 /DNA_END=641 /DNA_ORIENTATION=-